MIDILVKIRKTKRGIPRKSIQWLSLDEAVREEGNGVRMMLKKIISTIKDILFL